MELSWLVKRCGEYKNKTARILPLRQNMFSVFALEIETWTSATKQGEESIHTGFVSSTLSLYT